MNKLVKKALSVSILFFSLSFSYACGGKDSDVKSPDVPSKDVTVSVSPESLNPDFNAQTLEITVKADADWSVRSDAPWITMRPSGGIKNEATIVKVSIAENPDLEARNAVINISSGNNIIKNINVEQGYKVSVTSSSSSLIMGGEEVTGTLTITANGDWWITGDSDWLSVSPDHGGKGETQVAVRAAANESDATRTGTLTLQWDDSSSKIEITQLNYKVDVPEGYELVWCDEFSIDGKPGSDWVIENQPAGWVNHELQTYTSKEIDGKLTLECKDGILNINCFKGSDGKIYSGRMNALPSKGWTYGYVEARINLPKGKGTWPAFWMMPSNVDWNTNGWPKCGEIDIMEEVGVDANKVSSSLHTENYNHTKGTQKTHEMYLPGAEGEFHTYALEWSEDAITTYVDGKVQLKVTKAEMGDDHNSWPFHYAFYPILNLAWGGDWGGYAGVNENALPVTMLVDYVRIFQKK